MYSLTSTFKTPITILSSFNMYVIYSNTHILLKEVEKQTQNENMLSLPFFCTILYKLNNKAVVSTKNI